MTPVLTNGHDPEALRTYCREKCGVVLGHGIGDLSGKAFRIAQWATSTRQWSWARWA